jgi:hypothetical protein
MHWCRRLMARGYAPCLQIRCDTRIYIHAYIHTCTHKHIHTNAHTSAERRTYSSHAYNSNKDRQDLVAQNVKFYDVLSFDMSNMLTVNYVPTACVWVGPKRVPQTKVCVCDQGSSAIRLYTCEDSGEALCTVQLTPTSVWMRFH